MVLFFMTLYLTQVYHYSPVKAGRAISAWGVGALIGAFLGGKLTDKFGAYWVQRGSLFLEGTGLIILGYLRSFPAILAMMFCIGLVGEAMLPAISSAMSQVCAPEIRTKGFSLRRLSSNLGVTIGPVIGGYLAIRDYHLLFWADGITCYAALIVFLMFFKTSRPPAPVDSVPANPHLPVSIWKDHYFLKILGIVIMIGIVFSQVFNTLPLYYKEAFGFRENHIGYLMAINTSLIVTIEMALMQALRGKPLIKIIAPGAICLGLGMGLMPFGHGFLFAAFTVFLWSMGEILMLSPLTTLIAEHSNDEVRGKYMGFFSFAFSAGMAAGPVVGSKLYASSHGPEILWYMCGLAGVMMFAALLTLKKKTIQNSAKS